MSEIKPNHICKNPRCRREYYSCDYCDRIQRWKSVACSWGCFMEYQDIVINARSKGEEISTLPERTDMSENEVRELMKKPVEDVLQKTKTDLKEYISSDTSDFSKVVDKINNDLDKKQRYKKKNENPGDK